MSNYAERLQAIFEELQSIYTDIEAELNTPEPEPEPVVATEPATDTNAFSHGGIDFYVASTRNLAKLGYFKHYGKASVDNDPVGGLWYSASKNFGANDLPSSVNTSNVTATVTPTTTTGKDISIKPTIDDQIGAGWIKTNDGVKWSKGDRYNVSLPANKTDGVLPFEVELEAGTYTIEIDAKASEQTAGRHDLHNDVWFWMDDVFLIRKHFFNGRGAWSKSTSAEDSSGNHAKIQNTFTIKKDGKYVLNMSGRSSSAEVRGITIKS